MTALDTIAPVAARAAADLLARLDGARAVVVCTEDGFEVACATSEDIDVPRLSAIASSMSAIGDALSVETGIGSVHCVIVEAEAGTLVMRVARRDGVGLVVAALVGRGVLLGRVTHGVADMARGLCA